MADKLRRNLLTALRGLLQPDIRGIAKESQGASYKPRNSNAKLIDGIREARQTGTILNEALVRWVRQWNGEESPRVWQVDDNVLGPLGLLPATNTRSRGAAAHLIETLLHLIPKDHWPSLTSELSVERRDERLKAVKALPGRTPILGYLQIALLASDLELARAVNRKLSTAKLQIKALPREIDEDSLPWRVTPWGIVVLPRETADDLKLVSYCDRRDSISALACLIERPGGHLLLQEISSHEAPDEFTKVKEYVLMKGPREIIRRYLSEGSLWNLLRSWGLRLPSSPPPSQEELEAVLLLVVGLTPSKRPRGLFSLRKEVEVALQGASRNEVLGAREALSQFEERIGAAYLTYVSLVTASDLSVADLGGADGAEVFESLGIALEKNGLKSLPFREMSLGDKRLFFERFLQVVNKQPALRDRLERTRKTAQDLQCFVGEAVKHVVVLRNRSVHTGPGAAPTELGILNAVRDALDAICGKDPRPHKSPAPLAVRVMDETTDEIGWTTARLEDELGRVIQTAAVGWQARSRPYYLIATTNPVVVDPILVEG